MSNPTGDALAHSSLKLKASSPEWVNTVSLAQSEVLKTPQLPVVTEHVFHAGMYARTVRIPAGVWVTGVVMKIPTLLVIHGVAMFKTEDGDIALEGFGVLPGSAGRQTILVAYSDVEMTMIFPTQAKTVAEAEAEFTDQVEMLVSRHSTSDTIVVTGE